MFNNPELPPVNLGGKPQDPSGDRTPVRAHNWSDMYAIKDANAAAGYHFFKRKTMAYFASKVRRYHGHGVFVTQEKTGFGHERASAFTIRVASQDGQVHTFGDFLDYPHCRGANAAAKRLAALLYSARSVVDSRGNLFTPAA